MSGQDDEQAGPSGLLAIALMNTIRHERSSLQDDLAPADGIGLWLERMDHQRLLPAPLVAADTRSDLASALTNDRAHLLQLRGALRAIAEEVTGNSRLVVPTPEMTVAEATQIVNDTASSAPRSKVLTWENGTPYKAIRWGGTPGQNFLAAVATSGIEVVSGPRSQLRACHGPNCVQFFTQGHRRREWCSFSCGNRARVARHYARQHSTATQ